MGKSKPKNYHDYVIKGSKFIGKFEEMYKNCENPWPEDEYDLEINPVSLYTLQLIRKHGFRKLLTMGSGKGLHANWLKRNVAGLQVEGCEVSLAAVQYSRKHYPDIPVRCIDIKNFNRYEWDFDVILFREILWYILPLWNDFSNLLRKRYKRKHIIIEISCYDNQRYGKKYFDGPEDIIHKFSFNLKEILRHHNSPSQRDGMILLFGKI